LNAIKTTEYNHRKYMQNYSNNICIVMTFSDEDV
jgi:hypothetical protein